MAVDPNSEMMSHAIQLAIAPVFLLTGIAGLLGVIATRLGRIVDRARGLERSWRDLDAKQRYAARDEIRTIEHRRQVCSWAINFCTAAALLICLVIISLFLDGFTAGNLKWLAGGLFMIAMVGVIGGLSCFLREVYLSTHARMILDTTLLDWLSNESNG